MKNINTHEIKVNGNSKGVRCVTDGKYYPAMKFAAKAAGVRASSMSYAIKNKTLCKGKKYRWESEMESNVMEMGRQLSEMDALRAKAIAYDRLMAEQKAKEEAERKAKEEHTKAVAKAKDKVTMYAAEVERRKAKLSTAEQKLMCAEIELEALMDKEVK